jgi:hypothetical protein
MSAGRGCRCSRTYVPFGVLALRQASAMPVTPEPVVRVAEAPDGARLVVRAEPAPRATGYRSEGLRWWRSLVGDTRWWVTVLPINGVLAVMKESHPDEMKALARAEAIVSSIQSGGWVAPPGRALRRRRVT